MHAWSKQLISLASVNNTKSTAAVNTLQGFTTPVGDQTGTELFTATSVTSTQTAKCKQLPEEPYTCGGMLPGVEACDATSFTVNTAKSVAISKPTKLVNMMHL